MSGKSRYRIGDVLKNIGVKSIIATALVFLLTVAVTCVGGYYLYRSAKESIELQRRVNAVQSAKEFDNYLIIRKNNEHCRKVASDMT